MNHDRIAEALEGRLAPEELTAEENDVWFELFTEKLSEPSEKEKAFFARRKQLGLGVGLGEDRKIIRQSPDS